MRSNCPAHSAVVAAAFLDLANESSMRVQNSAILGLDHGDTCEKLLSVFPCRVRRMFPFETPPETIIYFLYFSHYGDTSTVALLTRILII